MTDDDLHRTSMLLTERQRDKLDELAYSRTEAVRQLIAEHERTYLTEDAADPDDRHRVLGPVHTRQLYLHADKF